MKTKNKSSQRGAIVTTQSSNKVAINTKLQIKTSKIYHKFPVVSAKSRYNLTTQKSASNIAQNGTEKAHLYKVELKVSYMSDI